MQDDNHIQHRFDGEQMARSMVGRFRLEYGRGDSWLKRCPSDAQSDNSSCATNHDTSFGKCCENSRLFPFVCCDIKHNQEWTEEALKWGFSFD